MVTVPVAVAGVPKPTAGWSVITYWKVVSVGAPVASVGDGMKLKSPSAVIDTVPPGTMQSYGAVRSAQPEIEVTVNASFSTGSLSLPRTPFAEPVASVTVGVL